VTAGATDEQERGLSTLAPVGDAQRRRIKLIVNPHATAVSERLRALVVGALGTRYEVEVEDTRARGDAQRIAAQAAADGCPLVVVFGGDGTVNEAANGLAGSETPLSALPGGSANVLCKMLGIPGEIVDATEHLLGLADDFSTHRIDLGFVEGRHYTFSAGVGIDASVVRIVDAHPELKSRLGPYFFLIVALGVYARRSVRRAPRMLVSADGGASTSAVTAVVQNGPHYTYFGARPIDLAQGALLDGGSLAAIVLRRANALDAVTLLLRSLIGATTVELHRHVSAFHSASVVTVSSADGRSLPLQLDGDYVGEITEARFELRRRALSVLA
jgi:diacylglycerol kinase family enzyme